MDDRQRTMDDGQQAVADDRRRTMDDGQQTVADDRRRTADGRPMDIVYIFLNIANVSDYVRLGNSTCS